MVGGGGPGYCFWANGRGLRLGRLEACILLLEIAQLAPDVPL
jgi:hypothetical protein